MENLAIFYGGKSSEHDISIITAIQVMNNIDKQKYNIIPVYLKKDGSWIIPNDHLNINNYANQSVKGTSLCVGFAQECLIKKSTFGFKKYKKIDMAINCCHGHGGEDGSLSGLLELSNIKYVGSGVLASAVGMDKVIMKDFFVANDIPCAKYTYFYEQDYRQNLSKIINKIEEEIGYPTIVKPANLGSSIGINISKNREELQENIEIALNFDKKIIIEEIIPNLREINCSVIGNYKVQEISVLEEPKGWKTFLDFDEKYLSKDENKKTIDVSINDGVDEKIKFLSQKVFKLLGCAGIVRIDFMLNDKTMEVFVNEINTIPGSFANYLWKSKYKFNDLIDKLIEFGREEYLYKLKNKYTFASGILSNFAFGGSKGKSKV